MSQLRRKGQEGHGEDGRLLFELVIPQADSAADETILLSAEVERYQLNTPILLGIPNRSVENYMGPLIARFTGLEAPSSTTRVKDAIVSIRFRSR